MRQPNPPNPSVTDASVADRSSSRARPFTLWRSPLACIAAGGVVLSGCERVASEPTATPEADPPTVVVAPPVLDRTALLDEIDRAASNFASGTGQANLSLAGRRFKVRQPMGCGGPLTEGDVAAPGLGSLNVIERSGDLRLALGVANWTNDIGGGAASTGWEVAEGFWLSWPWMRGESCPRPPLTAAVSQAADDDIDASARGTESPEVVTSPAVPQTSQTAALVSVFEEGGSRLSRRMGRAYEFVLRGQNGVPAVADAEGYRVVFEGRMAAFDDGQSIRCRAAAVDQRPVCTAAVHLERVAFETSKGQLLAEWR